MEADDGFVDEGFDAGSSVSSYVSRYVAMLCLHCSLLTYYTA